MVLSLLKIINNDRKPENPTSALKPETRSPVRQESGYVGERGKGWENRISQILFLGYSKKNPKFAPLK